jgi:hypothetical protein
LFTVSRIQTLQNNVAASWWEKRDFMPEAHKYHPTAVSGHTVICR